MYVWNKVTNHNIVWKEKDHHKVCATQEALLFCLKKKIRVNFAHLVASRMKNVTQGLEKGCLGFFINPTFLSSTTTTLKWNTYPEKKRVSHSRKSKIVQDNDEEDNDDETIMNGRDDSFDTLPIEAKLNLIHQRQEKHDKLRRKILKKNKVWWNPTSIFIWTLSLSLWSWINWNRCFAMILSQILCYVWTIAKGIAIFELFAMPWTIFWDCHVCCLI